MSEISGHRFPRLYTFKLLHVGSLPVMRLLCASTSQSISLSFAHYYIFPTRFPYLPSITHVPSQISLLLTWNLPASNVQDHYLRLPLRPIWWFLLAGKMLPGVHLIVPGDHLQLLIGYSRFCKMLPGVHLHLLISYSPFPWRQLFPDYPLCLNHKRR